MALQIFIIIFGTCISAIVGYILSSRENIRIVIRDACIGGAAGTVLLTVVLLQFELVELRTLRSLILKPNLLEQLNEIVKNTASNDPMLKSTLVHKDLIEEELTNIVKGHITLKDEDEVIDEWSRLFTVSGTNINATNYITPNFWIGGSNFSAKQFEIQKAATQRGVRIRRIFIYNENDGQELAQINNLANQQRSLKIEVKFASYEEVNNSQPFIKYSPVLGGAIDFVIYDLNVVLLTFPKPNTREIESGILTKERPVVDGARDLFEKLWNISGDSLPNINKKT